MSSAPDGSSPDYDEIVNVLAESVASITGAEQFRETVRKELTDVEGVTVSQDEIVADDASRYDVFGAIAEAVDREAKIVPVETILEAHGGALEDVDGGAAFVERYVD